MAENRYRKIEVRMWGDGKFRTLSPLPPSGQGLWLHLLTGPQTGLIPGLFRVGRAAMAEELDWPLEAFDRAFEEVSRLGMAKADWRARVVWIPNAIKCNLPQSPNVVTSWASEWRVIPECVLKDEAYETIRSATYSVGEAFRKAFDKAFQKPSVKTMPIQEQEQERKPSAANASVAYDESKPASASRACEREWISAKHQPEIIPSQGSPEPEKLPPQITQGDTPTSKKTTKLPSHEACRLAALLKSEILRNKPDFRITPPQLRKWELTADRMLRVDERTSEQIAELIQWVQNDEFWMANVLSMDTLRDKFDQLSMKAKLKSHAKSKSDPVKLPASYIPASEEIRRERNARPGGPR